MKKFLKVLWEDLVRVCAVAAVLFILIRVTGAIKKVEPMYCDCQPPVEDVKELEKAE